MALHITRAYWWRDTSKPKVRPKPAPVITKEVKGCFFDMKSGREVYHRVTDLLNEDSKPSTGTANAPAAPGVREELE